MDLNINKLTSILEEQKGLMEELLSLASQQLQALKQDDLDQIKNISSHQEYTGRRMAFLEQKRRAVLEEYSQRLGMVVEHISQLQFYVSPDDFAEIQSIRDQIINSSQKLQQDHELNALLLKQGLVYTARILGVLNTGKSGVYGKAGGVRPGHSPGLLDTNA